MSLFSSDQVDFTFPQLYVLGITVFLVFSLYKEFLNPPLTTVKIHGEHIGETAVDLLLERLNGREYGKQVRIATEFVWRGSCRKPLES